MAEQQGPPLPLLTPVRMFVSITYTENSSPFLHPQESDLGTHSRVVLSRFFHSLYIRANFLLHGLEDSQDQRPLEKRPSWPCSKVWAQLSVGILGITDPMTWAGQSEPWAAPKGIYVIPVYALSQFKYAMASKQEE